VEESRPPSVDESRDSPRRLSSSALGRRAANGNEEANPYDPAWELYFEERQATRMANTLTGRGTAHYLWLEQDRNAWFATRR